MGKWLPGVIVIFIVAPVLVLAILIGQSLENAKTEQMTAKLIQSGSLPVSKFVTLESFSELPPPVVRYFRHALTEGQGLIRSVTVRQSGLLRTSPIKKEWSSFTAHQLIVPPKICFIWNARVEMPLASHVQVIDSYIAGVGSGRVSILSAFAVASEAGESELNSGALHRYLAEAVWFPTALLPQSGVVWTPIDDQTALATLTDHGMTVSLEFQFNETGEVTGVYSPGRLGRFEGGYKRLPWEGHFSDYEIRAGMRIPLYGEVGWYVNGQLHIVWKGDLVDVRYEF